MALHPLDFRYGKALYLQAEEEGCSEAIAQAITQLSTEPAISTELLALLRQQPISDLRKGSIIQTLFQESWPPLLIRFLCFLIYKQRGKEFFSIAEAFLSILQEKQASRTVRIATAHPLQPDQEARLLRLLQTKTETKDEIQLEISVQPDLIGGVVIRAGDRMLDLSLKSRLRQMEKRLCRAYTSQPEI